MIVKMNKVTLLVSNMSQKAALEKLRELGVVHIAPLKSIESDESLKIDSEVQAIFKTLVYLPHHIDESLKPIDKPVAEIADEILLLQNKKEELSQFKEECLGKLAWFEEWGKVSIGSLKDLKEAELHVHFYSASSSFLKNMKEDKEIFILKRSKNIVHLALVSQDEDKRLNLKEEILPDLEAVVLENEINRCDEKIDKIDERFKILSANRVQLQEYEEELLKQLEFEQVKTGMEKENVFCYLQGFAPKGTTSKIKKAAEENGWGYLIDKPAENDEVPTLIKNPMWMNIVKPVFTLMGTIPGYKEFDISFWFMLFFSFFVAMLIGDAGYGLIFFIIAILTYPKLKKTNKELSLLIFVLSISTIIWGTLSGTWFGVEEFSRLPGLRSLIIRDIASFDIKSGFNDNQNFIMAMCLLIGAIHLTVAHGVITFRVINSFKALCQVGWIALIWGLYFVAGMLVLGKPLPDYTMKLLGGGLFLALFFENPEKNILNMIIGALKNLLTFVLAVISAFADVVSYLRLFAVGYATVIVAVSFNAMAIGSGVNSIGQGIKAVLVLAAGHSLNIVLGLMALIVHGIRLNMLEFSGHLNMEWSGKDYKPFKK